MTPDLNRALSGRPATTQLPTATKTEVHASLGSHRMDGPVGLQRRIQPDTGPDDRARNPVHRSHLHRHDAHRQETERNADHAANASDVYQNMTDDDLKAIFAYLRTIKPIRNAVLAGLTLPAGAKPAAEAPKK